jgi:ribonuclease R
MGRSGFQPMRKRALAKKLDIDDNDYLDFRHFLDDLVEKGEVGELKHGKYGLPKQGEPRKHGKPGGSARKTFSEQLKHLPKGAIAGRIDIKRGGFGFLLSDPPGRDLYISNDDLGGALSGDLVAVTLKSGRYGPRASGRVVRVLERAHPTIVGTFFGYKPTQYMPKEGPGGYVVPDVRGLFDEIDVLPKDRGEARDGDKVAIELLEADASFRPGMRPTGRVVKVFGEAGELEGELEAILQNFNLRREYPAPVLAEAAAIPETIPAAELARRVDYTGVLTFTIDPEDAKDHDDAVSLRILEGGQTELLVHIADVSHYVTEESPIDLEARERSTSVYMPGLTLPMLPEKLSSNVCSLREGELRLTKTIAMVFTRNLTVERTRIERSYIRSAGKLNYEQVRESLDDEKPDLLPSKEIYDALHQMRGFAKALRRKRLEAGSVDLDMPEVRLLLDEHGAVTGWRKEEHHWAHQLIEDMMLSANRAVAEYLVEHEVGGLFRVHEDPDEDALAKFAEFIEAFGLNIRKPYDRKKLKDVLAKVKGKDYEHAVNLALLTSLKQAHYSAECFPHWALAFTRYLHFTSPIRRYPDLIVHRALDERFEIGEKQLPEHGKKRKGGQEGQEYYRKLALLRPLAVHCSHRERAAAAAEEEVRKVRQIHYLRNHMRESHEGVITRVFESGFLVEMQDNYVEGFVSVKDLGDDDWFEYVPERHLLQGKRSRRSFRLGDKVTVRVVTIDVGARKVGLLVVNI